LYERVVAYSRYWQFPAWTDNHVRIAGIPSEIRNKNLPNSFPDRYSYAKPLGAKRKVSAGTVMTKMTTNFQQFLWI
jgi:hypothetical protein